MNENVEAKKPWTWIGIGWIGAFLIPIIGLVCGIVLLNKDEEVQGACILGVSIFMTLVWMSTV